MALPSSVAAAASVGLILLLGACAAPVPATSTSTSATAPPSAAATAAQNGSAASTPTPAPSAATDPDVLFTISATVSRNAGEVAHIVQTVYKPVATLPHQSDVVALLDEQCGGWRAELPAAQYVRSVTVADGGSWASGWVGVSMNGWPVYTGDFMTFQAYCATVRATFPGTITGFTPVAAGADSPGGWATLFYGFGIVNDPEHPLTPQPGDTILSECVITLGADALSTSSIAPAWPTAPQVYPGFTCDVNR